MTHDAFSTLTSMILEVLPDEPLDPIAPTTSFRHDLAFDSIQFIALAELIQDRYPDVDFVTWIQAKDLAQVMDLKVGDVAAFVIASGADGRV
ncbi:MAG TPA: acyl carrier protein [Kofleriaceae bacterium]|nr:acyl carrier protein [Kofleriaceae bacterium]